MKREERHKRMFVNKIAMVVKFHAPVKSQSTCNYVLSKNDHKTQGRFVFDEKAVGTNKNKSYSL